jgi:hypothetical protein
MWKEYLKTSLAVGLLSSVFCYLIRAFVIWDIFWIKDISSWSNDDRVMLVVIFVTKIVLDFLISITITDEIKKSNNK